jgi:hypothetical protein
MRLGALGTVTVEGMLDSTLEAGRECEAVGDGAGKGKPELQALPVRDPVDVLRATFAARAMWLGLFRAAGLSRHESEDLLHTIEDARGGQDHRVGRRTRALGYLRDGRLDWFESLVHEPARLPAELRAALAGVASKNIP